MPAKITLAVTKGQLQGLEFTFTDRTTCIMGRGEDCTPRLPDDPDHRTISRHHCLLDINPPDVRIRDFGSLNGTFVNGAKIGQRQQGQTPADAASTAFPEHDLKPGDQIELGGTIFQVAVFIPACCAQCSKEIPESERADAERAPGTYQCQECRQLATLTSPPSSVKVPLSSVKGPTCTQCGRDVSAESGANRQGDFICAKCKAEPAQIVRRLLEQSSQGKDELGAIQGYQIIKELGKGGMGAVYLASAKDTGELVALKVMLPRIAASEQARRLFLREVDNTKALNHPNLVRLHDSGCARGTFFFTLEYCDGGSVDKLMKARGAPLPLDEALAIALQALDGLEYAHNVFGPADGLIHRDLKPHNLFLSGSDSSRVAKVGDYGLGKAFDQAGLSGQTCTGAVMGTPAFTPRQQVVNFKYAKPEVDVWAMAATLYFMVTGKPPRDFTPEQDPWLTVLHNPPVPIRQRAASVPKSLPK